MRKFVDLEMLDRMDRLIRLYATGTPKELADRLEISYSTLYVYIVFLKEVLLAPIRYNPYRQSFEYEDEPGFYLGFEKVRTT